MKNHSHALVWITEVHTGQRVFDCHDTFREPSRNQNHLPCAGKTYRGATPVRECIRLLSYVSKPAHSGSTKSTIALRAPEGKSS
jgi:hypothetical protein